MIVPTISEEISGYLDEGIEADLIIACIKEAVSRNKGNWKYIDSILRNCINNNIKTEKQFYLKQKEFKDSKNKPQKIETKEKIEYEEVLFTDEQDYRNKLSRKE